ncbi:MAG: segregation/condensation protein A [Alphaproteobacteria bacterium]|nr:segregation/condensation protein A [Alphaproteobacteria bacterium]
MAESEAEPAFEADPTPPADEQSALVVDLDVYEGPIDVLLTLARDQKVDLKQISILKLADQYLAFIERARERAERFRIEIAADYLVMAAWLAFLKSRLLLPPPPEAAAVEPSPAEMAAALSFQLRRLQAMQEAGTRLLARAQLGRDVFPRGAPEGLKVVAKPVYDVSLYDMLKAYGDYKNRVTRHGRLEIAASELYSMEMAIERLSGMLGRIPDWATLQTFLPAGLSGLVGRSALAATFAAGLELVRTGRLQIRQDRLFGPIYVRKAPDNPVTELPVGDRGGEPPR